MVKAAPEGGKRIPARPRRRVRPAYGGALRVRLDGPRMTTATTKPGGSSSRGADAPVAFRRGNPTVVRRRVGRASVGLVPAGPRLSVQHRPSPASGLRRACPGGAATEHPGPHVSGIGPPSGSSRRGRDSRRRMPVPGSRSRLQSALRRGGPDGGVWSRGATFWTPSRPSAGTGPTERQAARRHVLDAQSSFRRDKPDGEAGRAVGSGRAPLPCAPGRRGLRSPAGRALSPLVRRSCPAQRVAGEARAGSFVVPLGRACDVTKTSRRHRTPTAPAPAAMPGDTPRSSRRQAALAGARRRGRITRE